MQTKFLLAISLLSTAASAATTTDSLGALNTASPAQVSQIVDDLGSYYSSVADQPAFSSVASVLATGLPQSIIDQLAGDPAGLIAAAATDTAVLAAFTVLPADVQGYLSSIGMVEVSIVTKDLGAGAVATATATTGGATATGTGSSSGASATATSSVVGSVTMVTSTRATVLASASTSSAGASAVSASTTPATTTSRAAAPSTVALKAAGLLAAAGAVGIALL